MDEQASRLTFFQETFGRAGITQALAVAAELGIANQLVERSQTIEELAEATQAHGPSLYRVLRARASVGVFAEDGEHRFSLTPLAELLRGATDGSQGAMAIMMGGEFHAVWGELLHSTQTGQPGFQKYFGPPFFQCMQQHPERHAIYDAAMTGAHGAETGPMIEAYDFSGCSTVADIGGGNGTTLAAILPRHPQLQGFLFDLPEVVDRTSETLCRVGLSARCRIAGGDFFATVPGGADAYALRHVLHDREDHDAITILRNCRGGDAPAGTGSGRGNGGAVRQRSEFPQMARSDDAAGRGPGAHRGEIPPLVRCGRAGSETNPAHDIGGQHYRGRGRFLKHSA